MNAAPVLAPRSSQGHLALVTASAAPRQVGAVQRALRAVVETAIDAAATAGASHPGADPQVYGVDVTRDVPYLPTGEARHLLDVYVPRGFSGPRPVVLYAHGGGFRLLSKDTHWMMAVAFARRGYVVFNVNYALSPQHAFPHALQDVSAAYAWVVSHAASFGGDASNIVLAGESAGANLVTALAIQTSYRRPEPWARQVFDLGVQPRAVVAMSGMLQVTHAARLVRDGRFPAPVADWILAVEEGYLGAAMGHDLPGLALVDPLRVLEQGHTPARPLPPFFASVGSDDPLVDDTLRLAAALENLGVDHRARVYAGQGHAFQMLTWRRAAKEAWRDALSFVDAHLDTSRRTKPAAPPSLLRQPAAWVRQRVVDAMAA
jgi:acetyl esterase